MGWTTNFVTRRLLPPQAWDQSLKTKLLIFITILAALSFLLIPRFRTHERQRGRDTELAKEMAERPPDFAAGYHAGEQVALSPATEGISAKELIFLSAKEFKKSGYKDAVNWRTGFQLGFKDRTAKIPKN